MERDKSVFWAALIVGLLCLNAYFKAIEKANADIAASKAQQRIATALERIAERNK